MKKISKVILAAAIALPALSGAARAQDYECSNATLNGEYAFAVTAYTPSQPAKKFNPHVTIGVGTEAYLNKMLAEPFQAFTFSPVGASVYQLGSFGTARKELTTLQLSP